MRRPPGRARTRRSHCARPYSYFVWANLAALAICAGPALGAGLHRSVRLVLSRRWHDQERLVPAVLTISALFTIGVADISALSKAETERIWLPFAFVLVSGLALLPQRSARWAITVAASTALIINHLLLTHW